MTDIERKLLEEEQKTLLDRMKRDAGNLRQPRKNGGKKHENYNPASVASTMKDRQEGHGKVDSSGTGRFVIREADVLSANSGLLCSSQ